VLSNCPVFCAFIRKYVESSIGQRTPLGTYTKEPSEKTAEFKAAYILSVCGTTVPKYLRIKSGYSLAASPKEQKITPCSLSCSLKVVLTDTESNTASTATPARAFCSSKG